MNKIKFIKVTNESCGNDIMRQIPTDGLVRDAELKVADGFCVLYVADGNVSVCEASKKPYIINTKAEVRNETEIKLYAVNVTAEFEIGWGFGGVRYVEPEFGIKTDAGMNGGFYVKVISAAQLKKKFATSAEVSVKDITALVIGQAVPEFKLKFKEYLDKLGYAKLGKGLDDFKKFMFGAVDRIAMDCGLMLTTIKIDKVHFSDDFEEKLFQKMNEDREIEEQREKDAAQRIANRAEHDRKLREMRDDLKLINEFSCTVDRTESVAPAPVPNNINIVINNTSAVKCPSCGNEKRDGDMFCNKCGAKY